MNLLFETSEGYLVASDCTTVMAVPQPDDDRWQVQVIRADAHNWDLIYQNLTESEAKTIVRKLFDYGRYVRQ